MLRLRRPRLPRPRLLPVTIAVGAVVLVFRVADLWFDAGVAIAPPAIAASATTQAAPPAPAAEKRRAAEPFTPEEVQVLSELARRRELLEARERELAVRESLLKATEERLGQRVGELERLKVEVGTLVRQYGEQEEAELKSVVKIYESMKPREAARILGELETRTLLAIMERMKERGAAPILAAMDPQRARELTTELARKREVDLATGATPGGG
ncbi:MAG: MotE family protein [Alphaproteobacteria bacterium]